MINVGDVVVIKSVNLSLLKKGYNEGDEVTVFDTNKEGVRIDMFFPNTYYPFEMFENL